VSDYRYVSALQCSESNLSVGEDGNGAARITVLQENKECDASEKEGDFVDEKLFYKDSQGVIWWW
jgi:hypothetical protein